MRYGRELPGYPYDLKAKLTRCLIFGQRQVFGRALHNISDFSALDIAYTGQCANNVIFEILEKNEPCLISRFGSGEMEAVLRGLDVQSSCPTWLKAVKLFVGRCGPFWWDNSIRAGIVWNAGYFPETNHDLNLFSDRVADDSRQIDLLGSWLPGEKRLSKIYFPSAIAVPLEDMTPFLFKNPWTRTLNRKKVLVVHPFADTITKQYAKRKELFLDSECLPDFNLITYRSVQSAIGIKTSHSTWFEALDKMCSDISKIDFEIALIGAGAYGMSIGAFIKRDMKKKGVHLGGMLQLIFGIKGRRWDNIPRFSGFYNDAWTRPLPHEIPPNSNSIEGGCYW